MKYYIVDSGEHMTEMADYIQDNLRKHGHHYINYLTNEPYYLAIEEVNEDTFLEHFKNIKTNG